jgi:hypothetical protein
LCGVCRPRWRGFAVTSAISGAAPQAGAPKRIQVWRHDVVDERLREAVRAIEEQAAELGAGRALEIAEQSLGRRRPATSPADALRQFTLAFAAASLAARSGRTADLPRYLRTAVRTLHGVGVGVQGSRLSYLHAELRDLAARAQGQAQAMELCSLGSDAVLRLLERELRHVHAKDAEEVRLARARVLRVSGALDASAEVHSRLRPRDDLADALAWERACLLAMQAKSAGPVFLAFRNGSVGQTFERQCLAAVWAYASKDKASMREAPRAATLERVARASSNDKRWARGARALENAYRSSLPLDARIHGVARILDDDFPDPEIEALTLGAVARWLSRAKQPRLAEAAAARYRLFCQSLSDGKTSDVFGLDLPVADEPAEDALDFRPDYAPPGDGRIARTLTLARDLLLAGVGGWLRDDPDEGRTREYVEILAHHVTVLKGPIQKVGQMLAYYGFPISEDSESVLSQLFDDAQPVAFEVIRPVAEEDLGQPLERAFRSFDEKPLAAGSIGQVHGATLADGTEVVVKVQYPRMLECVEKDFRSLALLVPLLRTMVGPWDWDGILTELRARVVEECDYRVEARHQQRFGELLAGEPRMVVPRVFPDFVGRRVFVAERFRGEDFRAFASRASEEERTRAAETITRYAIVTTMLASTFNSDLQPGNLLFGGDRVCFVDFGNVRTWDAHGGACWRMILEAFLRQDPAQLERGLTEAKMFAPGSYDPRRILGVLGDHLLGAVSHDAPVRIEKGRLMREILLLGPRGPHEARGVRIAPEYIYAFRMYWGLFAVLSDLRATVNLHRVCVEALGLRV